MTVSDTLLVAALGIPTALVGVIYKNLEAKIATAKDENKSQVSMETCRLISQLNEEKFINIHNRVNDVRSSNKEYQEALNKSLSKLHANVDSIRECVAKLSVGM